MIMTPYDNLPSKAFWKLSVANRSMFDISDLWDPKYHIKPHEKVATFGSCFAQHIGKALRQRGFNWLITETAPEGSNVALQEKYNYGIFTARTGNIYTTSLLKQWTEWALGTKEIPNEVWEKNGRYYDPFRPRVEPQGFVSIEELKASQQQTLNAFRNSIEESDYFVFTLGLTESWFNSQYGYEYPMCPGVIAGFFDDNIHQFVNQQFTKVLADLAEAIRLMVKVNPKLKFILTVSPVPLTATKSGKHVAVATMASKSVLRAVADQLMTNRGNVDYFPSYEIINSPIFKGAFFEPNQRNVNPYGVNFVMDNFFKCLNEKFTATSKKAQAKKVATQDYEFVDPHCEEELLSAFGDTSK
jgi:hypothetical protein